MPILVKSISGSVSESISGTVNYLPSLITLLQIGDYIKVYGFIGYLQNFKNTSSIEGINKPLSFGVKAPFNLTRQTLEISY